MPKEVFEEEKKALGVRLDELIAQGENLQKNMKVLFSSSTSTSIGYWNTLVGLEGKESHEEGLKARIKDLQRCIYSLFPHHRW